MLDQVHNTTNVGALTPTSEGAAITMFLCHEHLHKHRAEALMRWSDLKRRRTSNCVVRSLETFEGKGRYHKKLHEKGVLARGGGACLRILSFLSPPHLLLSSRMGL